jgi:hypothetical protein
MSYKKVLSKATILTIACFLSTTFIYAERNMNVDMSSAYFYKDSYEGFAGYCTIVTPEITEASAKMQKRLNIVSPKQLIKTSYNPENPYKNVIKRKAHKKSKGLTFADISEINRNKNKTLTGKPSPVSIILAALSQD